MPSSRKPVLLIALIAGLGVRPAAPEQQLEVRVEPVGGRLSTMLAGIELVANRLGGGEEPTTEVRWPLEAVTRIDLDVAQGWQLRCRGTQVWCPDVEVPASVSGRPASISLALYPAALLSGTLHAESSEELPESLVVQGSAAVSSDREGIELHEEVVVREASFSLLVPRGVLLDLRFGFDGWAPIYRWGVRVGEGSARLEPLLLRRGGSLSGWVRDRASEAPVPGASVSVVVSTSGDPDQRAELRRLEVKSEDSGFFQFTGLPPGNVRLAIRSRRHATLILDPVALVADSETLLGALHLSEPVSLAVQIQPPVDPRREPWRVRLEPLSAPSEAPVVAVASREGRTSLGGLRPARYAATVLSGSGDVITFEELDVFADREVLIQLPFVRVVGRVRLGEEPLEAHVALQTGEGDRVELESDEDGRFAGWMRRPERSWLLATVAWDDGGEKQSRSAELRPASSGDRLDLEIDLPDGRITGEVVDPEGAPVEGASVSATPDGERGSFNLVEVATDAVGRFHLPALEHRRYLVHAASSGAGSSEAAMFDLDATSDVSGVRLVLWPTRAVEGHVLTGEGYGVAGAVVDIDAFGSTPVSTSAVSSVDGSFRAELPESATRVVATVVSPSQLLWSGCLEVNDDSLVARLAPPPGGSLRVRLEAPAGRPPVTSARAVVVTGDGGFFELGVLTTWLSRMNGRIDTDASGDGQSVTYEVPAIAPGSYALRWSGEPRWQLALQACSGLMEGLDWVHLAPGSEASLTLAAPER